MDDSEIKYHNLKKIFSINFSKLVFSSKKYKYGMDEQIYGPLSWLIQKPFKTNIDDIYDTLVPIFNCQSSLTYFLNRISYILRINKAFTFSDLQMLAIKRTSSVTFLFVIFKILLRLINEKVRDNDLIFKKDFPRSEFITYNSDCINTKLYLLTCHCFNICYNPQMIIYSSIDQKMKNLISKINSSFDDSSYINSLRTSLKDLSARFDLIKKIIDDTLYNSEVNNFIEYYIKKNIHINDEFLNSILYSSIRRIHYFDNYDMSDNIRNYYLDIISGSVTNPHIRYNAMICILDLIDVKGFMGIHIKILTSIFKYFCEVNFYDNCSPEEVHNHLINLMSNISKICYLMNNNDIPKYEEEYNIIFKGIHKISSKAMSYLEKINDNIKIINSIPESQRRPQYIVRTNGPIINRLMIKIISLTNTLSDIIRNIISDRDQLTIELIMPINTLIIQIFKFFSDGSNPIYSIYGKNMESLDIMKQAFDVIYSIKENKIFKREIYEYFDIIKEVLPRIKFDDTTKSCLENYFNNFEKVDDYVDISIVPDDFIDPLLCTLIRDPIMIPHVDLIFDKSSILSQLYYENINPYTREPLSLKDIEEYNKENKIIDKINEFKNKFNEWKEKNIKQ